MRIIKIIFFSQLHFYTIFIDNYIYMNQVIVSRIHDSGVSDYKKNLVNQEGREHERRNNRIRDEERR